MSGNRTRAMAAPLYYAPTSIARPIGSTFKWCDQSGSTAREVCSATPSVPARWAMYAATDRLGHCYRQSRIDAAVAHSVLEQHSGLGGSTLGNRNDGKGRPARIAWSSNCNSYLDFYWSDLYGRDWGFPEASGFFSDLMKLDFIQCLYEPNPALHIATACLGSGHSSTLYKLAYDEIR